MNLFTAYVIVKERNDVRITDDSIDDVNLIKDSPIGIIGKVYLVGLSQCLEKVLLPL